ncbi:MAG: hypothetical protein KC656_18605, partial [Myxococcales bacterium]|nr:hypothetical protein [Myxococcales bacterium]
MELTYDQRVGNPPHPRGRRPALLETVGDHVLIVYPPGPRWHRGGLFGACDGPAQALWLLREVATFEVPPPTHPCTVGASPRVLVDGGLEPGLPEWMDSYRPLVEPASRAPPAGHGARRLARPGAGATEERPGPFCRPRRVALPPA